MCGVFGILTREAGATPDQDSLLASLRLLTHRGPDAQAIHRAPGIGLAHTRLTLVDPDPRSNQPFWDQTGRYVLVYNGELYNHQDFRPGLESRGVSFRGHSDTETLLWLLITYGEAILPRLNGIYAFAFQAIPNRTVLLARDPLGVKPLYYASDSKGRLLFASEIKALFADGQIEPRLMLPLSLTYDHRVVDGADGARFTSRIAGMLADPSRLMFES